MSRGVVLSVWASVLFAGLYYLASLLKPLTGLEVFGWRISITLPCLMLYMSVTGGWVKVFEILQRVKSSPLLALGLLASSLMMGVQLWLFLWAPAVGRGLNVSLGYFLLPLCMIVAGRLLFAERLTRFQLVAACCALVGVLNEVLVIGALAWETWLVAIGYTVYFSFRRFLKTNNVGGMWFDMALLLPAALYFLYTGAPIVERFVQNPDLYIWVPLMGLVSAVALICYLIANRLLSLGLFGLLSYLEPSLLVLVSLALGERIAPQEWATYIPIWLAVFILVAEGARHVWRQRTFRTE